MQFGCAVQKQNRISSSLPLAVFEDTHTWIFLLLLLLNRNQSALHDVLEMAYSGHTEEPAFSRNGFLIDLSHVSVNYLMNGEMSPTAYMSFAAERNAIRAQLVAESSTKVAGMDAAADDARSMFSEIDRAMLFGHHMSFVVDVFWVTR